jgi:cysteinyl-tRNA synthetase
MTIKFFNTLSRKVDPFEPVEPGVVRMYSCGPTVYDFAHIGNFRSFLFADLIRRFLEFNGLTVMHAMNITDVGHMTDDAVADGSGEDKMQVAAKRIKEDKKSGKVPEGAVGNPDDPYQIAKYYTQAFLDDARLLGMKVAFEYEQQIMHATQHIPEMLDMIGRLIENKHAYVGADGVVYYSVESFPGYGQLSGNTLDHLKEGEGGRISSEHQANKRHPADFMLWKPDQTHIMKWDSPWGTGYPGWHIECSAMARKKLERDVIDIHTGGEDLIFPHHECEIAQSCGTTGADSFAKFWMHARFLMVEGEKMSKSKGNFYTVRDVLQGKVTGRQVHPAVLRFELTKSHYRSNMNFTTKGLIDSAQSVRKLNEFHASLVAATNNQPAEIDLSHPVLKEFNAALSDDLNIAGALGVVFPWISSKPTDAAEALAVLNKINHVLNVAPIENGQNQSLLADADSNDPEQQRVRDWCQAMDLARKTKDWPTADLLRKQIVEAGFEVRQSPEGTVIQKKLA